MDKTAIFQELGKIALHQTQVLRREVMETNSLDFADLADNAALDSLVRVRKLFDLLEYENKKDLEWIDTDIKINNL